MRLKDKVALVTGGGQGIGKVTCLTFAREGASVAVCDINLETAQAVATEIEAAGGKAKAFQVNVAKGDSVEAAVQGITEWAGGVDILINNAGITRDSRLEKMTEEQFDAVIAVNLKGVYLCTKACVPSMIARGGGAIVNTASIVGVYGNFGQTNYVATKAGVIGMTKTWARELGSKKIRVNAVAPGFTATEMITTVPEKVLDDVRSKNCLRRLGEPQDIANAFLFLCSDESSYITAQTLLVDGGQTW
jgi:3-oxoacyl-[acyl-carrier protein] reductase